ncbi:SLC13 family permease [Sphingomonas melonis]|uniref:Arsenical pump membrane protein n=1 Tax=Sphingomonas melonis TaxID=152682 RepID=A0A7Y9FPS0_9SPHN|nr:SLC13 family permease [Sphingomonas melonis]NYD90802.1 arsenical pump membrane protein [Sphingomonas melonis]
MIATVGICAAATAGVIIRPFRWPEAVWAVGGALLLLALGLIAPANAWAAVLKGGDVYLFLIGMMLLSEAARAHGVFDWVAHRAAAGADGSAARLFTLVFLVGVAVTVFLSNDATAVVLTPAVYAVARQAKVAPLPLLFACALVANAASFVLPISNPANLVLYASALPRLGAWLAAFALPSILAIGATYLGLRWLFRRDLAGRAERGEAAALSGNGRMALIGIGATAVLLTVASALGWDLGWPTFGAGVVTALVVQLRARESLLPLVKGVSWLVLLLVAGLFVMVEALAETGLIGWLAAQLSGAAAADPRLAAAAAGGMLAVGSNLVNNLPAGLIAAQTIAAAHPPALVVDALLIGVDLGPNLSITGSLATILWLIAIRREGENVTFLQFLRVGVVTTVPALVLAIGVRVVMG